MEKWDDDIMAAIDYLVAVNCLKTRVKKCMDGGMIGKKNNNDNVRNGRCDRITRRVWTASRTIELG